MNQGRSYGSCQGVSARLICSPRAPGAHISCAWPSRSNQCASTHATGPSDSLGVHLAPPQGIWHEHTALDGAGRAPRTLQGVCAWQGKRCVSARPAVTVPFTLTNSQPRTTSVCSVSHSFTGSRRPFRSGRNATSGVGVVRRDAPRQAGAAQVGQERWRAGVLSGRGTSGTSAPSRCPTQVCHGVP